MGANAETKLRAHLIAMRSIEEQSLNMVSMAVDLCGDEQIAGIYRVHYQETTQHLREVVDRLDAYGIRRSPMGDLPSGRREEESGLVGLQLCLPPRADCWTLGIACYAFENLEIAAYQLLQDLAARIGDNDTSAVADHILEQEEGTAERIASSLGRVLELAIEPAPPGGSDGSW